MNRKCSTRRLFLKILQYSHKNSFFNKNAGLQALSFIKKILEHRCFLRTLRNFHLNSRPEVFRKKGVLRSFTKFTGRYLRPATLLKKRLWHRCFPVNFAKFLKTPFLQNTSGDCFFLFWSKSAYGCFWEEVHLNFFLTRRFLKNKTKKTPVRILSYTKETCLFIMFFIISFFSFSPLHVRWHLPCIITDDTSEGFETA